MAKHTYIKLKTSDRRLIILQQPLIASGDVGTVYVEYVLDDYWDGYTTYGVFYTGKYPDMIFETKLSDNACVIPWEVLQYDGVLYIGLRGTGDNELVKTAAPVRYRIAKGSYVGSNTPQSSITPSDRIQAAVDAYLEQNGISGSGIGTEAKNLLIEVLRNATYTTNMSDTITRLAESLNGDEDQDSGGSGGNSGGSSNDNTGGSTGDNTGNDGGENTEPGDDTELDTEDPYEKVLVNASVSAVSNTQGVELGNYGNGQRATILASDGAVKIPVTGGGQMTNYSLIRIPRNADKVTIAGSAEFTFGVLIFELTNGTTFSKKVDSGWIDMTDSKYTYTIQNAYADGKHYIAVNFRLDNANTFDAERYQNTLSMSFGDVVDNGSGSGSSEPENDTVDVSATLVSASVTGSSATGAELGNYENNQRATLLTTNGDIKLTIPATGETTNYSLIRIPVGAAALKLTGSSEFHYGISVFALENGIKYMQQNDSGWIDMTSGETEYAIAVEYADGSHYIAVNFRLDTYETFSASDYADVIHALFILE